VTDKNVRYAPDFWITKEDDLPSSVFYQRYDREENETFIIWHCGVLAYYDGRPVDWFLIAEQSFRGTLAFREILGWFKVVIYQKSERRWLFFGDNCGSQCFFLDKDNAGFSDRLLTLREGRGSRAEINMEALADMICREGLIGTETPVKGIFKSDPDEYYIFQNSRFDCLSKALPPFSEEQEKMNITDILKPVIDQIGTDSCGAVCTGGTDSRAVLAALDALGCRPELVLTAYNDNPDVESAKKVAEALGSSLTVIDPTTKEQGWLDKGLWMTDGMYDAVLSYRHYRKALWSKNKKLICEFGGVGGEFYKNTYCKPFRWLLCGKKDAVFLKKKLLSFSRPGSWCGEKLNAAFVSGEKKLSEIAETGNDEKSVLSRCNRIGFFRLSAVTGSITGGYAPVCFKIDPLMDRRLIGSASRESSFRHFMHMWQRRQIARDCAALSDLPTDQRYSCSLKVWRLFPERLKRLGFYLDRVFNRIKRKLGFDFVSKVQHYWDRDYLEARNTKEWEKTLTFCREKGIIRKDIDESDIPLNMTGILIQIGLLFSKDILASESSK